MLECSEQKTTGLKMASVEDSNDLLFLESVLVSEDETDAVSAKVIAFEKDSEIPPKYFMRKIFSPIREPPCHFDPAEEKILRRKKILSTWGAFLDEDKSKDIYSSNSNGILALLTFEPDQDSKEFNKKAVQQIFKSLTKLIGVKQVDVYKFDNWHVMVEFCDSAAYRKLGELFMREETQNINGFKLVEIQAVSVVNPKPCYLELSGSSDEGQELLNKLSSILVTFSSKFSYLSLREPIQKGGNGTSPSNSPQVKSRKLDLEGESTVPAFGLMMMFTARAQKNADTLLGRIKSSSEWKEITMPKQISEEDELHFDLSNKTEVLFSVKQGSPFAGIKITVFVNENFEEMERFYSLITGKSPLAYSKIEEGLCLRTYSLSSKLELQLVRHRAVESHHLSNAALCFAVEDINKLLSEIPGGVRNIGEDHWQVTDPDGNSVILYSLLK